MDLEEIQIKPTVAVIKYSTLPLKKYHRNNVDTKKCSWRGVTDILVRLIMKFINTEYVKILSRKTIGD